MKKTILFILLSLVMPPFASAWGIAYASDHFTLEQGQKQDIHFTLQNYVGDDVKRIIIELGGDKEIATILDKKEYYLLPPRTKDQRVTIQVAIPERAKQNYSIKVNFISYTGDGGVSLSNVKVIPLTIDVPDGTLNDTAPDEQPLETSNLTETYQEIEEKIEKAEGNVFNTRIQGLTVLEEGNNVLPIILLLGGLLALLILISSYHRKKRQERLGLR